jgi:hypothetical protein
MRFIFLVLSLLALPCFYGQADNQIRWNENYRLHYSDFQATPPADRQSTKATTSAAIEVHFEQAGEALNISVWNYFTKNESWMRNESKNEYTLKHEQGHFDITEIFTRRIRKKLSGTKMNKRNCQSRIKKIFTKQYDKYKKTQVKYDKATSFAVKEKEQQKWINKIAAELKELDAYKSSEITIKFK